MERAHESIAVISQYWDKTNIADDRMTERKCQFSPLWAVFVGILAAPAKLHLARRPQGLGYNSSTGRVFLNAG